MSDERIACENGVTITLERGTSGSYFLSIERDGKETESTAISREERKRLIAALIETL